MSIFLTLKNFNSFFLFLSSIILFLFCLYLYYNNKKLKERISKLEIDIKEILERKIVKENPKDLISINNLSKEIENIVSKKKINKINENKEIKEEKIISSSPRKDNLKKQISIPIKKINNNYYEINYSKTLTNEEKEFNIDEFIKKDLPETINNSDNYLDEISTQIEDYLKPKTIELTEYEKKQEEQAVISYQELLNLRNKLQNTPETEENINFIEDLKQFRNKLN